jgi:hypothetical protein
MEVKKFNQMNENRTTLPDNEVYEFGLKMSDIRRIIHLLFSERGLDMEDKDVLDGIKVSLVSDGASKYIHITEPNDWQIKIYEYGYVSLENAFGSMIRYKCAKEIYSIITNNMK